MAQLRTGFGFQVAPAFAAGCQEANQIMNNLESKVAVVSGAGRGIGRSIAIALARAGADVVGCSRTVSELESLASEINQLGQRCATARVDVADWENVKRFAETVVAEFGRCDILVNNAGGTFAEGELADSDPALWTKTVDINLYGTYFLTRALLADIPSGGKIINIASGMGLAALPGNSSYAAAKAAVHMLTQVLSQEVWERGIEVNDVIPGLVATTNVTWASDRSSVDTVLAEFADRPVPFAASERVKHPDEVGELVAWMAGLPPGGPTGQSFSLARRPL